MPILKSGHTAQCSCSLESIRNFSPTVVEKRGPHFIKGEIVYTIALIIGIISLFNVPQFKTSLIPGILAGIMLLHIGGKVLQLIEWLIIATRKRNNGYSTFALIESLSTDSTACIIRAETPHEWEDHITEKTRMVLPLDTESCGYLYVDRIRTRWKVMLAEVELGDKTRFFPAKNDLFRDTLVIIEWTGTENARHYLSLQKLFELHTADTFRNPYLDDIYDRRMRRAIDEKEGEIKMLNETNRALQAIVVDSVVPGGDLHNDTASRITEIFAAVTRINRALESIQTLESQEKVLGNDLQAAQLEKMMAESAHHEQMNDFAYRMKTIICALQSVPTEHSTRRIQRIAKETLDILPKNHAEHAFFHAIISSQTADTLIEITPQSEN